jgi:hypothetical protein
MHDKSGKIGRAEKIRRGGRTDRRGRTIEASEEL